MRREAYGSSVNDIIIVYSSYVISVCRKLYWLSSVLLIVFCRDLCDIAIFRLRPSDHITDALVNLHWLRLRSARPWKRSFPALRVSERIVFKAVQTCLELHADAPQYLRQFTKTSIPPIVCLFLPSGFLLLDIAPFLSLVHINIHRGP